MSKRKDKSLKTKHKILVYLSITVLAFLYFFLELPIINPLYPEGAFFWIVLVSIYIVATQLMKNGGVKLSMASGTLVMDYDKNKKSPVSKKAVIVIIALFAIYFIVSIISSPLFFYKQYRDQMPEAVTTEFTADMQTLDLNQIPIVDKALAQKLADKQLGEKPSLGSQVVLGEPTIQHVDGKLVWVVPLYHSGFFKWLSNLEGSSGYIVVSATNMQDVKYVEDYNIKIQPNAYLFDDLLRHVRFGPGAFTGTTDYSFELDDEGNPYWVVTSYQYKCGFALPEANGVILVNAVNGDMIRYAMSEIPEWIDRVQPEDFIIEQINNKGQYVHGVFNFANTDKTKASDGHAIIYNKGDCYLFTGVTSVGADESAIGFTMVNLITKEPIFYQMSGATEGAAQHSAAGKVQDLGYTATFPIVLNVEGNPTYFMTLKDNSGLIKKYAFVSIRDYSTVGVGDTVRAAQEDYLTTLSDMGAMPDFGDKEPSVEAETAELSGAISRINWNIVDGVTEYTFMLAEETDKIFVTEASISPQLPLTQVGDSITFTYEKAEVGIVNKVTKLTNDTLNTTEE